MSSLVAYEDSESEDDCLDQTEEAAPTSVKTGSCEQNQELRVCTSTEVTQSPHSFTTDSDRPALEHHGNISDRDIYPLHPHSQLRSCFDWEGKYFTAAQEKHFTDTTAPLSFRSAQGKILPVQTLPHMPRGAGDGSKTTKRHHTVAPGVRPYIPKRQRLPTSVETVDPQFPAEQVPGNQTREILSEVSARVKPYLTNKVRAAGIPRKLLMSLGGHQGPVNTVQWCPVPHLSHLLLSASMDKTFKV